MAEKVGEIFYTVTLDTREMIAQQRQVDRELKNTSESLGGLGTKLTAAAAAVAVLAAAYAALKTAKLADEFRLLGARVEVAAGSIEAGAAAMNELTEISRRTQSSLAANIDLFTRLNTSMKAMGGTQQDTLRLTETIAQAMKVSGASVQEAASTLRQFGQALGKGNLNGDELTSLLENAPYLARKLAEGLGVPIGALKELGEQGKLTSDVLVNALTKASAEIQADFQKFPQTIEAAMVVAQDSAALAALKFDELSGSSAALTGATKGLGEVLDKLADQFGAAKGAADGLGRNGAIQGWAQTTRTALSYVIDAADLVWQTLSVLGRNVSFVFTAIGTEIGGIAAQAVSVAKGDFAGAAAIGDAMKADAEKRRKDLDAADAKTLGRAKLAGQEMREAWEQGAGGGRGFVNPAISAPSKLKGGDPSAEDAQKMAAKRASAKAYLEGLVSDTKVGLEKIDAEERQAMAQNAQRMASDPANAEIYAKARTEIEAKYSQERSDLYLKEAGDRYNYLAEAWEKEKGLEKQKAEEQKRGRDMATDIIVGDDPIAKLQAELLAKSELLLQAAIRDRDNEELYATAKVALEKQTAEKIAEIVNKRRADEAAAQSAQLANYSQLFGGIADVTKAFAGEQSGIYKAMFAASKAFAIADAIIKIQQGIANAAARPFPENMAAIGSVVAATSSVLSTIRGTSYGGGREYGGPVSADKLYRVGEKNKPEMFMSGGKQYMIPGEGGRVISNDQMVHNGSVGEASGTLNIKVELINQGGGAQAVDRSTQEQKHDGSVLLRVFLKSVADDIASGGVSARAMQSRFPQLNG